MDAIRKSCVLTMDLGLSFAMWGLSRESQLSSTMALCKQTNKHVETKTSESSSKSSEDKDSDVLFPRKAAVNLNDPHC